MTIGFDGSRTFIGVRTGTENYSYQLLKALSKVDKKNKYIVYIRSNDINDTAVTLMDKFPKNFEFRKINWKRFWTQGGLALRTFKDDLDVLFVPAHTLPILRRRGLKTVMTVHDLGVEYLPQFHQLKQQLYLKYITRYQLKSATRLIAVSKATKEDLVKRGGINPQKISVIYEGYDKELFKPVSAKGRSSFGRNSLRHYNLETGTYFLFVGTVQPRKNLTRLIEAFSRVILYQAFEAVSPQAESVRDDKLKLVIAGLKGWISDEIYTLPSKLGIQDKVKFLGYVPDKDMPALYSGAIALTFPSLFEGFGLPILEAQAYGCPVITSNVSSMPEVAGKGALYVDPYSLNDIIRGIREIRPASPAKRGEGIREELIKAGFENIKRFSWEKCAAQTLLVFENL